MDGFKVMTMAEAAKVGDLFITVTGCKDIITKDHFTAMKDGAICCNAGHFNVEINLNDLDEISTSRYEARKNIEGFKLSNGNTIFILAEGRLVNLASGDGHPAEIMDMSFSIQALSVAYLVKNKGMIPATVITVPEEIDNYVAKKKLASWGVEIDALTQEQRAYMNS